MAAFVLTAGNKSSEKCSVGVPRSYRYWDCVGYLGQPTSRASGLYDVVQACVYANARLEIIAYSQPERPKGMDEKRAKRYEERVMERVEQELGYLENEAPIPWYWLPKEWREILD